MTNEIKTEDIIESLRICAGNTSCTGCVLNLFDSDGTCMDKIVLLAADRLEQMNQQHIKIQYSDVDPV